MKAKHELKIEHKYFQAVKDGRKKFEIRKNDRGFQEGDLLILREYDPITQEYLGRIMKVEISYMTDYAQQDGYVVLGIEVIQEGEGLTEIKKVVIPKFIAESMQGYDSLQMMLWEEYDSCSSEEIDSDDVFCWIDENFEMLCRAWLDGYEVKKEKLYYVKLPISVWSNHLEELETEPRYLHFDNTSDEFNLFRTTNSYFGNYKSKLTEQQIKSIDERYWAFAVEVEGEE